MKGFLTFSLVAGVAITSTSVVHAAGIAKGAASVSKAPASAQGPMAMNSMGLALDRMALSRELTRLNDLLTVPEGLDADAPGQDTPVTPKSGLWTW